MVVVSVGVEGVTERNIFLSRNLYFLDSDIAVSNGDNKKFKNHRLVGLPLYHTWFTEFCATQRCH